MTDEYLQVAFEIKATCDEISRRLLRWHWEKKPGAHSFDALLEYAAQRREESPAYYDRLPDLSDKTSWQQLDTTICMRILLDPEQDAKHPVDLIGNTAHPAAARRACNAVRTARNEAAHASDRAGAGQAAILFSEAVESLEEGYANSALQENELARYYRRAEDFIARLSSDGNPDEGVDFEGEGDGTAESEQAAPPAKRSRKAAGESGSKKQRQSQTNATGEKRAASGKAASSAKGKGETPVQRQRRKRKAEDRALTAILLAAVVIGLILRASSMGLI